MLGGSFEASCVIVTAKKLSAAGQHFLTLNSTREHAQKTGHNQECICQKKSMEIVY